MSKLSGGRDGAGRRWELAKPGVRIRVGSCWELAVWGPRGLGTGWVRRTALSSIAGTGHGSRTSAADLRSPLQERFLYVFYMTYLCLLPPLQSGCCNRTHRIG